MFDPKVIYETGDFLAVNKPAGLLVHGVKGKEARERTLVDWLVESYPQVQTVGDDPEQRPGLVHRLDKETSGVLVIAKTQLAFEYLKSLFQDRRIKKTYLALVRGRVEPVRGKIEKPIGIKAGTTKRSVHSSKFSKEAVTEYTVKTQLKGAALLDVHPLTGRTHQIRVHLASIGHPVLGDSVYGGRAAKKLDMGAPRLMLHAYSIEFQDPKGHSIKIEAEPPEEFSSFVHSLDRA